MDRYQEIIQKYYQFLTEEKWYDAGRLLSTDVEVRWPNSQEKIQGRSSLILTYENSMENREYVIEKMESLQNRYMIQLIASIGELQYRAISFIEFKNESISDIEEFWGIIEEIPLKRKDRGWTEKV